MRRAIFRLIVIVLTASIAVVSQSGCNENTIIDAKVAPNLNNLNVQQTDSFTILAKTVYDDSVITSLNVSGLPIYHALGSINNDPFFGKTNAGIYMQIIPQNTNPTLFQAGSGNVIDSAILVLPYGGYTYGDTSGPNQTIKVYPITDTSVLSASGTYYPSYHLGYDNSSVYGTATLSTNGISSFVNYFGALRAPFLRIPLNTKFLTDLGRASNDSSSDYPTFLTAFKGLYIAGDSTIGSNSLPYFSLSGVDTFTEAGVLVYYHTASSSTPQIFQYPFSSTYCGHFNRITRDYAGSSVNKYFNSILPSDSLLLLQNQPGATIDLKIPFLKDVVKLVPKMIINKAELIITEVVPNKSGVFTEPIKLYARGVDANQKIYEIADRYPLTSTSPLAFLDGFARPVTVEGNTVMRYTINIPREVMNTIAQQRELHLHVNGTQDYYGAYRLIAGGSTADTNFRVKLNIVYSIQN